MRNQNYLAIDLELNNKNDGSVPRIIQVGCAIGSPTNPEDIKTFSWYLDPGENITPFITKLTGINDEIIIEKAVTHRTLAQELGELIRVYDIQTPPIVWGGEGVGGMTQLNSRMSSMK